MKEIDDVAHEAMKQAHAEAKAQLNYFFLPGLVYSWRDRARAVSVTLCDKAALCVPGTARPWNLPFVPASPSTPKPLALSASASEACFFLDPAETRSSEGKLTCMRSVLLDQELGQRAQGESE